MALPINFKAEMNEALAKSLEFPGENKDFYSLTPNSHSIAVLIGMVDRGASVESKIFRSGI